MKKCIIIYNPNSGKKNIKPYLPKILKILNKNKYETEIIPTKYKEHASVRDSMIANGAVVNGTVEHSIIGRDVIVGEGAVIKNSIIFSGSVIDPGSVLENVIMDKHARVKNMKNLKGELKEPLFIKEGDVV